MVTMHSDPRGLMLACSISSASAEAHSLSEHGMENHSERRALGFLLSLLRDTVLWLRHGVPRKDFGKIEATEQCQSGRGVQEGALVPMSSGQPWALILRKARS